MLVYSTPLQKKALEADGRLYNSNSSHLGFLRPVQADRVDQGPARGVRDQPGLQGHQHPLHPEDHRRRLSARARQLAAYQNNEIDFVPGQPWVLRPTWQIIEGDPDLTKEYHTHYGDFRTYYFFFDDSAGAVQRPAGAPGICPRAGSRRDHVDNIVKSQGMPAYSYLMPGFPDSNCRSLQGHLSLRHREGQAAAGRCRLPERRRFPQADADAARRNAAQPGGGQAYARRYQGELGIEVEVANMEHKTFMDATANAKPTKIQFGLISYGMDFLDREQHAGRVQVRRPPQLEQRGVRQAGNGCFAA